MAIYHLHVKNIGRRFGRSIVAAAAYRAGETLPNEAEERESNFGGRRDVVHAEIRLPAGAPAWMADRARLWNAVEAGERRKDARLAKEIEFALPRELPPDAWREVARRMADAYTAQGVVVDLAIHDDGLKHNPHVHLLLTTRPVTPEGFGKKLRDADARRFVIEARARWAAIANEALGKVGAAVEIDARSNAARGIVPAVSRHRGPDPYERRDRRAIAAAAREVSMGKVYDYDPEAYREVLKTADLPWRAYAGLTIREDWPPQSREMPADLDAEERRAFMAFWDDVDRASHVIELVNTPVGERDPARLPVLAHEQELFDRLEARRIAEQSIARFRAERIIYDRDEAYQSIARNRSMGTLREWQELERRLHERMYPGEGRPAPTDWHDVQESMNAFHEKLLELRVLEEENRRYRERFEAWSREQQAQERDLPAPGPDGDLVPQRELDEAQDRMLDDMERQPVADRSAPAIERSHADGHDQRLPGRAAHDRPAQPTRADDLDWLEERISRRPGRNERDDLHPERDRSR